MAIFNKQNDLTIASLKENLIAIKYCLSYDKSSINQTEHGCLGIPATILMCSIIDTIGSYYRGSESIIQIDDADYKIKCAEEHFYILNHMAYFNMNLSMETIKDFYSTYRSKLTHNSSLPAHNYLYFDKNQEQSFHVDNNKKITQINLHSLSGRVDRATDEFIYHLGIATFSEQHKVSKELKDSAKNNSIPIMSLPSPSGFTHYDEYLKTDNKFF